MPFSRNSCNFFLSLAFLSVLSLFQSNFSAAGLHDQKLLSGSDCPMNFGVLRKFMESNEMTTNVSLECQYALQGVHLVQAVYLRTDGLFLPPLSTAESCWEAYQDLIQDFVPNFDVRSVCGFQTSWIAQGCMNITSRSQFESVVPDSQLQGVRQACNQSLLNNSPCASCTTRLSALQASYLNGPDVGNVSDCAAYTFIYAAGVINSFGPTNGGTSLCLFSLSSSSGKKSRKGLVIGVVVACFVGVLLAFLGVWFSCTKRCGKWKMQKKKKFGNTEMRNFSGLDSISASTTLVRFSFEEIKLATRNFSRDYIIGKGGYGNVYKGMLSNGVEVALKRFKNCSAAGDANFAHEVEVIASVRHVNLVALIGYCIATTSFEGHQRIIVCDLMRNGSLYDHLFASDEKKLSWPIRQKIAIGTARGLAYLHYGAQPAIIHRDIKASNILLDENFEPKVADFGLAKFTPEGMTHLSTRVAGTLGYVAPEYALYGQLTERSDVYSFGVVLLELLSGRKALVSMTESQTWLVTDWAWSLVRRGRAMDVIEEGMPEMGPREVLEKYVLVAVLASHPQLHARPTMDQIVKILETDLPVPSIPERPIPIVANMDEIERSASSCSSGHLSSSAGYQPFTYENDSQRSNFK